MWIRVCPKCKSDVIHKNKKSFDASVKAQKLCTSCSHLGYPAWNKGLDKTDPRMVKHSKALCNAWNIGKENGRTVWNVGLTASTDDRIAQNAIASSKGLLREYASGNIVPWNKGKPHLAGENNPSKRPEVRQKIRVAILKSLENKHGRVCPGYNSSACELFEQINKEMNWKGLHAENGGEYHIKELGYFVDYYEPNLNIVIEFDEKQHRKSRAIVRDKHRQDEIEQFLNCKFYRIPESEKDSWKQILKS